MAKEPGEPKNEAKLEDLNVAEIENKIKQLETRIKKLDDGMALSLRRSGDRFASANRDVGSYVDHNKSPEQYQKEGSKEYIRTGPLGEGREAARTELIQLCDEYKKRTGLDYYPEEESED